MDIFAILAGSCCTFSFVFQIRLALKKQRHLSNAFLMTYLFGVMNWGLFGLTDQTLNVPLVVISALQALSVTFILLKGMKNDSKA